MFNLPMLQEGHPAPAGRISALSGRAEAEAEAVTKAFQLAVSDLDTEQTPAKFGPALESGPSSHANTEGSEEQPLKTSPDVALMEFSGEGRPDRPAKETVPPQRETAPRSAAPPVGRPPERVAPNAGVSDSVKPPSVDAAPDSAGAQPLRSQPAATRPEPRPSVPPARVEKVAPDAEMPLPIPEFPTVSGHPVTQPERAPQMHLIPESPSVAPEDVLASIPSPAVLARPLAHADAQGSLEQTGQGALASRPTITPAVPVDFLGPFTPRAPLDRPPIRTFHPINPASENVAVPAEAPRFQARIDGSASAPVHRSSAPPLQGQAGQSATLQRPAAQHRHPIGDLTSALHVIEPHKAAPPVIDGKSRSGEAVSLLPAEQDIAAPKTTVPATLIPPPATTKSDAPEHGRRHQLQDVVLASQPSVRFATPPDGKWPLRDAREHTKPITAPAATAAPVDPTLPQRRPKAPQLDAAVPPRALLKRSSLDAGLESAAATSPSRVPITSVTGGPLLMPSESIASDLVGPDTIPRNAASVGRQRNMSVTIAHQIADIEPEKFPATPEAETRPQRVSPRPEMVSPPIERAPTERPNPINNDRPPPEARTAVRVPEGPQLVQPAPPKRAQPNSGLQEAPNKLAHAEVTTQHVIAAPVRTILPPLPHPAHQGAHRGKSTPTVPAWPPAFAPAPSRPGAPMLAPVQAGKDMVPEPVPSPPSPARSHESRASPSRMDPAFPDRTIDAEVTRGAPLQDADPLPTLASPAESRPGDIQRAGMLSGAAGLPQLETVLRDRLQAMVHQIAASDTQVTTQRGPSGKARTEIELSPPELGRLTMVLQSGERGLQLQISVERPETLDLIRRHIDGFQRSLQSDGVTLGNLNVTADHGSNQNAPAHGSAPEQGEIVDPQLADMPHPAGSGATDGNGRLDIRI